MTKEIIDMAKQAGCIPRRHPEFWEDVQVFATPDVLVAFANLVAAKEREACAKYVENLMIGETPLKVVMGAIGDAIRSRGEA